MPNENPQFNNGGLLQEGQNAFNGRSQLVYPPDPQSRKSIETAFDEFGINKIIDLFWDKVLYFHTFFEAVDGYFIDGSGVADELGLLLTTGATSGNYVEVAKQAFRDVIKFNKNSRFRTSFSVGSVAAQDAYVTIGTAPPTGPDNLYGFHIANATLRGYVRSGSITTEITLKTLIADERNIYEAKFSPGDKVVFYIYNSTLDVFEEVGSITSNVPTSFTAGAFAPSTSIKTNENVLKTMRVYFFEYLQER